MGWRWQSHGKSYTCTGATTLTLTEGPFTISVPVWTKTSTSCSETATATPVTPVAGETTWAAPAGSSTTPAAAVWTYAPSSSSPVSPAVYTGAANALNVGAGLAGVGAIAAFLL